MLIYLSMKIICNYEKKYHCSRDTIWDIKITIKELWCIIKDSPKYHTANITRLNIHIIQ